MPSSARTGKRSEHPKVANQPGARAAWGTISRRLIVDAALRLNHGAGFEQMTMRGLAAELGVAPMSLYRHVRDKDDLLDDMVDELLRRRWRAPDGAAHWREWIVRAADSLRELLVTEPAALAVHLRHPVVSPAALGRMQMMLTVLHDAGFDDDAAREAYAAVQTYTVGFAALEAARARAGAPGRATDALTRELSNYASPRRFAESLGYLLEGLEAHLRTGPTDPG